MYSLAKNSILSKDGSFLIESVYGAEKSLFLSGLFLDLVSMSGSNSGEAFFINCKPAKISSIKNIIYNNDFFKHGFTRLNIVSITDIAQMIIKNCHLPESYDKPFIDLSLTANAKKYIISKSIESTGYKFTPDFDKLKNNRSYINSLTGSISFLENTFSAINNLTKDKNLSCISGSFFAYQDFIKNNGLLFNENIISLACRLLNDEQVFMPKIKYLLIDDAQDLNALQYMFLKKIIGSLSGSLRKMVVSANPLYTLTAYKGSSVTIVNKIKSDFNIAKENIFEINASSRSPFVFQNIIKTLSSERKQNKEDYSVDHDLFKSDSGRLYCCEVNRQSDEPFFIASKIKEAVRNGVPASRIGIAYYRIQDEALFCANTLNYFGIPNSVEHGLPIESSACYELIHNCISLVLNKNDNTLVKRVLCSSVLSIGGLEIAKIEDESRSAGYNNLFYGAIRFADQVNDSSAQKRLLDILFIIKRSLPESPLSVFLYDIARVSALFEFSSRSLFESQVVKNLLQSADLFDKVFNRLNGGNFPKLSDFSIFKDYFIPNNVRNPNDKDCGSSVKIVSIFNCDCYDFDTVFVPCVNAKVFPDQSVDFVPPMLSGFFKKYHKGDSFYRYDKNIIIDVLSNTSKSCYLIYSKESGDKSPVFERLKIMGGVNTEESSNGYANYNCEDYISCEDSAQIWLTNNCFRLKASLAESITSKLSGVFPQICIYIENGLVNTKKLPALKLPDDYVFSVTGLDKYLMCPRKFFLQEMMKIKMDSDESFDKMAFGKIVHEALELFHFIYPQWGHLGDDEFKHREDILRSMIQKNVNKLDCVPKLKKNMLLYQALNCMGNYLELLMSEVPLKIIYVEKKIDFMLDDVPFSIKIDRIDNGCMDSGVRIIDYKTKNDIKKEVGLKNMFLSDKPKSFQLPVYYFAVKNALGLNPSEFGIFYLQAKSDDLTLSCEKTIIPVAYEESSKKITEIQLNQVKSSVKNLAYELKTAFLPYKGEKSNCFQCEYKLLCGGGD